uniref:Chemotaxis protein CheA n=1 Tax=Tanacetum cinerariifolium TaxID=118510 RepID=A0A699GF53_TANCI|nr:hypothetical protein [Tanacetum cinerariifolium]
MVCGVVGRRAAGGGRVVRACAGRHGSSRRGRRLDDRALPGGARPVRRGGAARVGPPDGKLARPDGGRQRQRRRVDDRCLRAQRDAAGVRGGVDEIGHAVQAGHAGPDPRPRTLYARAARHGRRRGQHRRANQSAGAQRRHRGRARRSRRRRIRGGGAGSASPVEPLGRDGPQHRQPRGPDQRRHPGRQPGRRAVERSGRPQHALGRRHDRFGAGRLPQDDRRAGAVVRPAQAGERRHPGRGGRSAGAAAVPGPREPGHDARAREHRTDAGRARGKPPPLRSHGRAAGARPGGAARCVEEHLRDGRGTRGARRLETRGGHRAQGRRLRRAGRARRRRCAHQVHGPEDPPGRVRREHAQYGRHHVRQGVQEAGQLPLHARDHAHHRIAGEQEGRGQGGRRQGVGDEHGRRAPHRPGRRSQYLPRGRAPGGSARCAAPRARARDRPGRRDRTRYGRAAGADAGQAHGHAGAARAAPAPPQPGRSGHRRDAEPGRLLRRRRDQSEAIAAIFRAAHTIKGSAGLFSLDHIVAFTHVVESLLDAVREGRVALDDAMITLLLSCCDYLSGMTDGLAAGRYDADPDNAAEGEMLLQALRRHMGDAEGPGALAVQPEPEVERIGQQAGDGDCWHISLRFGRGVLQNGMDPIAFLRYLARLGRIAGMATHGGPRGDPGRVRIRAGRLRDPPGAAAQQGLAVRGADPRAAGKSRAPGRNAGPVRQRDGGGTGRRAGAAVAAGHRQRRCANVAAAPGRHPGRRRPGGARGGGSGAAQAEAGGGAKGAGKPFDPGGFRQARSADRPGGRIDHRRRARQRDRPAPAQYRPAGSHVHPVRTGGGRARRRARPAHGQNRRHVQPLPARGARRGAGTGQGHRPDRGRRGCRTGQDGGGKNRRSADAPGAQCDGPRHRAGRCARGRRQAGQGDDQVERVPRVGQHRDPGERRRGRPAQGQNPGQGHRARAGGPRAQAHRQRNLQPDLRSGRGRDQPRRRGRHGHRAPAAHAGHHRRLPGAGGDVGIRDPARHHRGVHRVRRRTGTGLQQPARTGAAVHPPAVAVPTGRRTGAAREHRGAPLRQGARGTGGRYAAGRIPDRDQAAQPHLQRTPSFRRWPPRTGDMAMMHTAIDGYAGAGVDIDAALPGQFLTFMLGEEQFAVGILHIKEIIEYAGMAAVPMMPDCVRGVINLRGAVVPVIDLKRRQAGTGHAGGRRQRGGGNRARPHRAGAVVRHPGAARLHRRHRQVQRPVRGAAGARARAVHRRGGGNVARWRRRCRHPARHAGVAVAHVRSIPDRPRIFPVPALYLRRGGHHHVQRQTGAGERTAGQAAGAPPAGELWRLSAAAAQPPRSGRTADRGGPADHQRDLFFPRTETLQPAARTGDTARRGCPRKRPGAARVERGQFQRRGGVQHCHGAGGRVRQRTGARAVGSAGHRYQHPHAAARAQRPLSDRARQPDAARLPQALLPAGAGQRGRHHADRPRAAPARAVPAREPERTAAQAGRGGAPAGAAAARRPFPDRALGNPERHQRHAVGGAERPAQRRAGHHRHLRRGQPAAGNGTHEDAVARRDRARCGNAQDGRHLVPAQDHGRAAHAGGDLLHAHRARRPDVGGSAHRRRGGRDHQAAPGPQAVFIRQRGRTGVGRAHRCRRPRGRTCASPARAPRHRAPCAAGGDGQVQRRRHPAARRCPPDDRHHGADRGDRHIHRRHPGARRGADGAAARGARHRGGAAHARKVHRRLCRAPGQRVRGAGEGSGQQRPRAAGAGADCTRRQAHAPASQRRPVFRGSGGRAAGQPPPAVGRCAVPLRRARGRRQRAGRDHDGHGRRRRGRPAGDAQRRRAHGGAGRSVVRGVRHAQGSGQARRGGKIGAAQRDLPRDFAAAGVKQPPVRRMPYCLGSDRVRGQTPALALRGWRQRPHAAFMVGRVLGIGVHFRLRGQLEAGRFGQADHVFFMHIAGAGRIVLLLAGRQAVLHHAEHAARFQARVHAGKQRFQIVGSRWDPVMDVAEGEHHVHAVIWCEFIFARRREHAQRHLVVHGRIGVQARHEALGAFAFALVGGCQVVPGGDQFAALAQVRRQDLGVPAGARRQLHHRHVGTDAEEGQRFVWMAVSVALHIGGRARGGGDGGFQLRVLGLRVSAGGSEQRGAGQSGHEVILHTRSPEVSMAAPFGHAARSWARTARRSSESARTAGPV